MERDLIERYGNYLTLKDLSDVLHMSYGSVRVAMSAGRFPIKTFKVGRRRLARAIDVAEYVDKNLE